jgi:MscS family membrane protein
MLFENLNKYLNHLVSEPVKQIYQQVFLAYQNWLVIIFCLSIVDLVISVNQIPTWLKYGELFLSLAIAIATIGLGFKLFQRFFDFYLLNNALKSGQKVNSDFLILAKFLANAVIVLIVIFSFAETHQINLFGLVASLGIGGLAIAFSAQKILEQLLGGIVLYLDRPFTIDDYIHLPDGTFGRVESIGWRSTKIRTSGKGSLVIVPNSFLTQVNIENLTGAKKIISLIYLTFYQTIPEEEKALIRQVIIESTKEIFGIDSRSTEVIFKELFNEKKQEITQAQINFFLLGSSEVSMDLRQQLLDIAKQIITEQLKEYGIGFDIQEQTINVNSPITI